MPYYMYISLQDDDKILMSTMDVETGHLTPQDEVPVGGAVAQDEVGTPSSHRLAGIRSTHNTRGY